MYCTTKELLLQAKAGGYAVGAFNAENMEMAMAIVAAAEELHAPVLLQTTPSTVRYAGLAHQKGIPVEAELGRVGGKEDDLDGGAGNGYTDPADAVHFVKATGVDSLAVAIGTAHGFYQGTPVLDVARLTDIRRALCAAGLSIPLVLHGASGLTKESIRACVREGICKVNFATELRVAYTAGVREVLDADSAVFDPKKYGKVGMARVCELVKDRMAVCGCAGKA